MSYPFHKTLEKTTGNDNYLNSGVRMSQVLNPSQLDFRTLASGFNEWTTASPRVTLTQLNMPKDCLNLGPHCHPGGELAVVTDGCYFDARIDGSKMWEYPKGSVVF